MKNLLSHLDPYRQSFLFFKWGVWSFLFLVGLVWFLLVPAQKNLLGVLLHNSFLSFPNYLVHEFSHRIMWGVTHWEWGTFLAGNGVETFVPLVLCVLSLQIRGGRYLQPGLLSWLSSTLYDAGIYAADARACKLHLTSSDLISNFGPGTKGDWYYILEPLNLLEWDTVIGQTLLVLGVILFAVALYSVFYYVRHLEEYAIQTQ